MVFLKVRRDSRVTTGNSGFLLCWPREVQSSIRVARESWGLRSSHCRAKETSSRPSCPSPSAGDLRELPRVPLRGEGSCGGGQGSQASSGSGHMGGAHLAHIGGGVHFGGQARLLQAPRLWVSGVTIAAGNAHLVGSWVPIDQHPVSAAEG